MSTVSPNAPSKNGGFAVVAVLLLGGCTGVQSVLAPEGPVASRIAILTWIMFIAGAVIFLGVLIATWMAIYGSDKVRKWLGRHNTVVIGGIAFPVVTLTFLLVYGVWLMEAAMPNWLGGNPLRIHVVGEQWWWRVIYTAPDGTPVASANEIRLPVAHPVEFTLSTADVIHSFWVPNLAGKMDMIPGRANRLRLSAENVGYYRGQCAEYCGGPHALMAFDVVVMPPADFERWFAGLSAPAAEPVSTAARRGKGLFSSSGCGGCHAISGTEANGRIGPDLTHVGGRTSLGAAILPNTEPAFARWIAEHQQIKPGNHMPPYHIFSQTELAALAAYLKSLR